MSTNASVEPPDSLMDVFILCFRQRSANYHFIVFAVVNVPLVLPLCLYILLLGLQRWWSRARISHSDFFTYNNVVSQLLSIAGSLVITVNLVFRSDLITTMCTYIYVINFSAVVIFQILTCVERYLAVVHPVVYLRLKSPPWSLIRNASCAYVWLASIFQTSLFSFIKNINAYVALWLGALAVYILLVLFCNLCVLRVLIQPGPGDGARSNQKSKQRTFNTIAAITVTLLLMFVGNAICATAFVLFHLDEISCTLWFSVMWFNLPGTLVLPLLYMNRHGKLPRLKAKK